MLAGLPAHPAAHAYERGRSIATNALPHVGQDMVVKLDVKDFFPRTSAHRIGAYFVAIGWSDQVAALLTKLTTADGGLPQGAPTSPRLSNLVNYRLDARLAGLAAGFGARYTRYSDDMTISLNPVGRPMRTLMWMVKTVLNDYGYKLHQRKKLAVLRRHQRQQVTGLVVNDMMNLPRKTRRLLRAVEHRMATGGPATMTADQLAGWRALERMVYQANQVDE